MKIILLLALVMTVSCQSNTVESICSIPREEQPVRLLFGVQSYMTKNETAKGLSIEIKEASSCDKYHPTSSVSFPAQINGFRGTGELIFVGDRLMETRFHPSDRKFFQTITITDFQRKYEGGPLEKKDKFKYEILHDDPAGEFLYRSIADDRLRGKLRRFISKFA